jgi:hypothetical protein
MVNYVPEEIAANIAGKSKSQIAAAKAKTAKAKTAKAKTAAAKTAAAEAAAEAAKTAAAEAAALAKAEANKSFTGDEGAATGGEGLFTDQENYPGLRAHP